VEPNPLRSVVVDVVKDAIHPEGGCKL
jgi:hypothetical protein